MKYFLKTQLNQFILFVHTDRKHHNRCSTSFIAYAFIFFLLCSAIITKAQSTIASGSFIINMGITPQTVSNGLKPYGLVYDLVTNYNVPVIWSINTSKAKDGADFTYNSTSYKGGTFIIPKDYIDASITSRITYWTGLGVQGAYATANFTAPVYDTITAFPKMMLDTLSGNEQIISDYYTNAGIPSSSYKKGVPANLTDCYDLWSNPHADPSWSTHGFLYNFVTVYKGNIWSQCHTVSMMEGCKNSSSPYEQLNFLSTAGLKCYANNKCGSITENHGGNPNLPGTYNYPGDPMMQFMSTLDDATQKGSEKWFQPISTGQWNSTTKRLITTSDGTSPGEGILMAYGPAYGLSGNGTVMYESGHDLNDNGTTSEKVAAQRAYFNFSLYTGSKKKLIIQTNIPQSLASGDSYPVSSTITSGTGPFTYQWSSVHGGSFNNANAASTTYYAPIYNNDTTDIIKLKVTDACGRVNFKVASVTISHFITLPITLTYFDANVVDNKYVLTYWNTASELNNDHFTVERSRDAIHYEGIGEIQGSGNSSAVINYSFIDDNPYSGVSYYRLKQNDYDNSVYYSPAVSVYFKRSQFSIYPNPIISSQPVTVNLVNLKNKNISIQIYDLSGKRMTKKDVLVSADQFGTQLDLNGVPAGMYLITFSSENFFQQADITVQ